MAKKKTNNRPRIVEKQHYCGDCGNGVWYYDHTNLDHKNRLPICCKCKYSDRSMIRDEKACEKWIPKKKGELVVTN